jgi:hypothetical protein
VEEKRGKRLSKIVSVRRSFSKQFYWSRINAMSSFRIRSVDTRRQEKKNKIKKKNEEKQKKKQKKKQKNKVRNTNCVRRQPLLLLLFIQLFNHFRLILGVYSVSF